jgi:hypothetical protein
MAGGSTAFSMILSLKNNRRLLHSLKKRKKYAYDHAMEPKKRVGLKIKSYPKHILLSIREKSKKQYLFEKRRELIIILIVVLFGLILFPIYLNYLGV